MAGPYVTLSPSAKSFITSVKQNMAYANSLEAKRGVIWNNPVTKAINGLNLDSKLGLDKAFPGLSTALSGAMSAKNNPGIVLGGSGGKSAGSAGSPSGSSGAFAVKNGKVQFADKNLQAAMTMINQQAQANNEWNAQQAQKQMDFQKMMSDTAHQREVADLQAAGLNPVLSAGGSGAQAMSGASASADDSNTRLIAELAAAAIEAVQNTAVGVSGAVAAGSRSSSLLKNPYVSAFMRSGASVAGAIGARALLGAVGL